MTSLLIVVFCINSYSAILPLVSTLPKVTQSYDTILLKTWQGLKKRNIDPYAVKLVHRPKSEYPGDAVSEGVGYGMLLALYCNDQEYFNKLWFTAEQYMWQGEYYDWWVDKDGARGGTGFTGAATDAEEDIAIALIFADQLVKRNVWTLSDTTSGGTSYETRAKSILASIKKNMLEGSYLRPGAAWGGAAFVNAGYFAPAWYRVFAEFDSTDKSTWNNVIDQCYATINLSPGYSKGLVPDWMKPTGEYTIPLGYNPTGDGKWLYKDAIRVYWRLATDYLWYDEVRAKTFLQKAIDFVGTPSNANFFQMDGSAVTGTFTLGNNAERPRTEHSHLTLGMWACASMVAGTETADTFSDELLAYYDKGADYWGKASDTNNEDTLHNEMYFDQFLAWFGGSLISGVFTNLWEDLKDTNPSLPLAWVTSPELSSVDINADIAPLAITAELNKSVRWTVTLTHRDSVNSSIQFSGSGTLIDVSWYGLSSSGAAMPQGFYDIVVTAKGLSSPVNLSVWLGKAVNLLQSNRLIVDDFRDSDLKPFIGSAWTSYLDSYEGKTGASSVTKLAVEKTNNVNQLHWQYLLDAGTLGFDPYAALELNCVSAGTPLDITGVDTIIVTASAKTAVGISFQIVTNNITDYSYYDDSLYLTTQAKEYKIAVSEMKQRFGGTVALDLTKVTAIRFQVQQKTGTANELIINNVLFGGNVSKLYTAPPAYITMGVNQYRNRITSAGVSLVEASSRAIKIRMSKYITDGEMHIVNVSGKTVAHSHIVNSNIVRWNGGNTNSRLPPGIYFVAIRDRNAGIVTVPVTIVK